LRNIIAVLLVMNRPSLTKYVRTSTPGRGFFKGKVLPYLSHTTVTIDLDARPTLKLIEVPLPGIYPVQRHFDRVMAGGMAETVRLVGNRVVVGLVG